MHTVGGRPDAHQSRDTFEFLQHAVGTRLSAVSFLERPRQMDRRVSSLKGTGFKLGDKVIWWKHVPGGRMPIRFHPRVYRSRNEKQTESRPTRAQSRLALRAPRCSSPERVSFHSNSNSQLKLPRSPTSPPRKSPSSASGRRDTSLPDRSPARRPGPRFRSGRRAWSTGRALCRSLAAPA